MNNNQKMIFLLIHKREQMKARYYYIKDKLRPQEYESVTNTYLANVDWIDKQLKYYRDKESGCFQNGNS